MMFFHLLFVVVVNCVGVDAKFNIFIEDQYNDDPYLKYRPEFARSLPIQILLTGIVLTLAIVLLIHLVFTAQYHWSLAQVNYALQISGVTSLLISTIATLHVVLSATLDESKQWPYMISYIAVNVPPMDNDKAWSVGETATWLFMNASTSGLIQITHIQFLTLLYPSRLEGRLIFCLLGPLALISAIAQLIPIQAVTHINTVASAIRNVCNATLSLIFTVSLFIWGFLINRRQAWRMDGGTAIFGCAALILALVSTALNFFYIPREEEYFWLPGLMWAVILWQSFLGWWWWVGAGASVADGEFNIQDGVVGEKIRAEKREKRRRERAGRRKETRERVGRVWKGVTGAFGNGAVDDAQQQRQQRKRKNGRPAAGELPQLTSSNLNQLNPHPPPYPPLPRSSSPSPSRTVLAYSSSTNSSNTLTSTLASLPRFVPLPTFLRRWFKHLRVAHQNAAREQAAEQVERIREMNRPRARPQGWALGGFVFRHWRRRDREQGERERDEQAREQERQRAGGVSGEEGEGSWGSVEEELGTGDGVSKEAAKEQNWRQKNDAEKDGEHGARRSIWWWGPLSRWRLQDSTVYPSQR